MDNLLLLHMPTSVICICVLSITSGLAAVTVMGFLGDVIVAGLETEEQDLDDRQQTGPKEDAQLTTDLRNEADE